MVCIEIPVLRLKGSIIGVCLLIGKKGFSPLYYMQQSWWADWAVNYIFFFYYFFFMKSKKKVSIYFNTVNEQKLSSDPKSQRQ